MAVAQKQPYVRFFASDWLGGTRGMRASEVGVYITLLALMYERCEPLPEDHRRMARQCGCTPKTFTTTLDLLIEDGKIIRQNGGLWNKRVEKEFKWRAENSHNAREAAEKRWQKDNEINEASMQSHSDRNANAMPIQKPEAKVDATASTARAKTDHLVGVNKEIEPLTLDLADGHSRWPANAFDVWYARFPNKVGKQDAAKAFAVVKRSPPCPFDEYIAGLDRYIATKPPDRNWCNPATFIRQGRWSDRPAPAVNGKPSSTDALRRASVEAMNGTRNPPNDHRGDQPPRHSLPAYEPQRQ